ncbi:hypothetical protein MKW98_004826 [Papaver atlanticum]|uniref:Uncharacterized protein n=1 Tax=Papaver atlanticum TaxID=357466 RepID=A0AAD4SHR8_9MAGN|nr:hypothetical protein MKW98_004826 [Papaver atlanticum]
MYRSFDADENRLEDLFETAVKEMDFGGIYALGITNCLINRVYKLGPAEIYIEVIAPFAWKKHEQVLFEDVNKLQYLDLELGNSCRKLVENPAINGLEVYVNVTQNNPPKTRSWAFKEQFYPPQGSYENYFSLEKIIAFR